ncbi:HAD family hydrolase [Aureivirga sp. CE67]|uniref:HAD family hydrolase n=1 Tax=Aureivirga sp. CE67 TaxID=1788983 RepID=UPI0018CA990F|nr:HAD family hydrolase [Aureivirga sp. CE67]
MYSNIKTIAFDADDTLWINETYFREAEAEFCELLKDFGDKEEIDTKLFNTEIQNLVHYGYGIKGFTLSMMECALEITNNQVPNEVMNRIIQIGKDMLNKPVVLLENVEKVLKTLHIKGMRLVLATKGDLLDQERKLEKSGLDKYFHHIEVMSDKKEKDYIKLIKHLDIEPEQFLMIGNSLRSDVLPLVKIGAKAIYVPFHTTWQHEAVDDVKEEGFEEIDGILEVLNSLKI